MARGFARPISGSERPSGVVYSLTKIAAIAGNTFTESVRQPVYASVLAVAACLILLSPYITMFTLQNTQKMIVDMGLATVLLAGLLMAAFTASSVISQEIDNRTVLTVISKPVGRAEFIIGKFIGVMAGLFVAIYLLSITLILTVSGGALEAQNDYELSLLVVGMVFAAMFLSVCYGIYSNFFNDKPFASRAIGACVLLFTICFVILGHYDAHQSKQPWGSFGHGIDLQVVYGCLTVYWAVLVLASIAVAASTRLSLVVNISICSGIFLLGLLSEYLFRNLGAGNIIAYAVYLLVPNLQAYWISDYLAAGVNVPLRLVSVTGIYAFFHIAAFLFLGMALFRNRQVT